MGSGKSGVSPVFTVKNLARIAPSIWSREQHSFGSQKDIDFEDPGRGFRRTQNTGIPGSDEKVRVQRARGDRLSA